MVSQSGAQWYTVFTKPRKEFQVAAYLQSNKIEVYHPLLRVNPVNPRAAKTRSFFPRYLFVYADLDLVDVSCLLWAPGAVGLVEFGGVPAIVPDAFVHHLRQRIANINARGGSHLAGLHTGDSVNIKAGPFAGYDAIFDTHLSDQDRVQVLLHWLGREMRLRLSPGEIEKRR